MVEAGVVDLMLAFQGVAALPVVVAQFVVNAAMFLSLQALPGGSPFPVPSLEAVMVATVSAAARLRRRRRKNYDRMVFETMSASSERSELIPLLRPTRPIVDGRQATISKGQHKPHVRQSTSSRGSRL
jgi:hypothetical protein